MVNGIISIDRTKSVTYSYIERLFNNTVYNYGTDYAL